MAFDPDKYLNSRDPKEGPSGFDPDSYLEKKAPSQLKDEKTPARDDILGIPISTIEGGLDALPFAGALVGGTLGLGAGGPLGAVGGAGLGAGGGEALANAIRSGLDLESAPQTRAELYGEPIKEGLIGATGEMGGQIISKVPALIKGAPKAIRKATSRLPDEIIDGPVFKDIGFQRTMKPNVTEIQEATKRLGGKATPGMVTSNPNIQNVENVLSQAPTFAGERVRQSYKPITKGLQEASEELAGNTSISPFEAGEQFKAGLSNKIGEKVKPLSSKFEEIRSAAKNIRPSETSLNRASQRLLKQDLAEFANLPQGQAIQKYASMIKEAKSLDSLKQLRSSAGTEMEAAMNAGDGQLSMALGKVKSSIQRLERREILKAAIEAMPTKSQGEAAAKELISDLKNVNRGWRSLMGELESVAKAGGIKKIGSPKHLIRIIDDMPSEKISERFFNAKNYQGLKDVKTYLPDEFDVLRQAKLSQIAQKSMTKGNPDPVKLIRNIKSIGKEARGLLFGESGEKMLADMETVLNSMPSKVGTSDTPRGIAWFKTVLTPSHWGDEAHSAYNYMQLQGRALPSRSTPNLPKSLPRAAGYLGVSELSNQKRGKEKWADTGFEKVSNHVNGANLPGSRDALLSNPKTKKLLIQASDLKPGSKAMDNIVKKIKAEIGEAE